VVYAVTQIEKMDWVKKIDKPEDTREEPFLFSSPYLGNSE